MRPFKNSKDFLRGEKILLRNLFFSDVNSRYLSWLKDRDVNKFMSSDLPTKISQLQEYYRKINKSKKDIIFAITLLKSKKHIGNATLQKIEKRKGTAIFGIMIGDKKEWNKGYGKEATNLVLQYGFLVIGIKKICLGVFPHHKRAIRLYGNSGFRVFKRKENKILMRIDKDRFMRSQER